MDTKRSLLKKPHAINEDKTSKIIIFLGCRSSRASLKDFSFFNGASLMAPGIILQRFLSS